MTVRRFARLHQRLTRRYFLQLSAAGMAVPSISSAIFARGQSPQEELDTLVARLEPYFTPAGDFKDVSRGNPLPHSLPDEKKREVGMTRESWRLEVVADPEHPSKLGSPLTKTDNSALDFAGLLRLAEKQSVRFAKVMSCLNIGRPLGMGIWEGVPLRDVLWLTNPKEDLRRVFYYGYHNDDPKQIFRSSLPVGRVLEDTDGLPPVILCYKLNGEWLDSVRGGPVRIVVPEAYGFKSIKWLSHVVLSNLAHANDTYADGNNDLESPLKTFAAVLSLADEVKAGQPIPITGYAQVGISGLSKVQVWAQASDEVVAGGPAFPEAPWRDVDLLNPPEQWGAVPGGTVPPDTIGFHPSSGRPTEWPMRLARVHWATLLPSLPAGEYTLRSRTIDTRGIAQPMPRPFRKSGHAAIEERAFRVV